MRSPVLCKSLGENGRRCHWECAEERIVQDSRESLAEKGLPERHGVSDESHSQLERLRKRLLADGAVTRKVKPGRPQAVANGPAILERCCIGSLLANGPFP